MPDTTSDPTIELDAENAPAPAAGLELIGRFDGSGLRDDPCIVRKSDGQMVQLPELLFILLSTLDGTRRYPEIAAKVSEKFGRELAADDAKFLVEEKLAPLGLIDQASEGGADAPPDARPDPMLALRFKFQLVPASIVRALAWLFKPLFHPLVMVPIIIAFIAMEVWLFGYHGVAQPFRQILYEPLLMLAAFGMIVLSAGFHELGHAAGCAYGGATPGGIGAGIYVAWPAFYTDVTDAYRLGRGGRLRTDIGGIYFNAIFSLVITGIYVSTGQEYLLAVVAFQQFEIIHQLLPFLRLDGYYILADVTGVPDLFNRIKPVLRSLMFWKPTDPAVSEMKPWVRATVTVWVLVLVPLLLFQLGALVLHAPRIFGTAWDSMAQQGSNLSRSLSNDPATAAASGLQIVMLALPLMGLTLTLSRTSWKAFSSGWAYSTGRPVVRVGVVMATLLAASTVAYAWWPSPSYTPFSRTERGTLGDFVRSVPEIRKRTPPHLGSDSSSSRDSGSSTGTKTSPSPNPSPSTTSSTSTGGTVSPASTPSPSPSPPTSSPSPSPQQSPSPQESPSPTGSPSPTVTTSPTGGA